MKYYVVDAFAESVFEGNPAGVCVLKEWPEDRLMQNIAMENNLSETAFTVKEGENYRLRWFTPGGEIDLCGHATLATAFVLANYEDKGKPQYRFETLSGQLIVESKGELLELDFPAYQMKQVPVTDEMEAVIGKRPLDAYLARDLVCVLEDEADVRGCKPDMVKMLGLDGALLHITAPGADYDCVSRSFAPKLNVPEDPVCGSGHCHIVPIWAKKLGKAEIKAYQASARGGVLHCAMQGERVKLAGKGALYAIGELHV